MKKAILGIMLMLSATSLVSFAQESAAGSANQVVDCSAFNTEILRAAADGSDVAATMTDYLLSCPTIADQIIEVAISATLPSEHQQLMQIAADTNLILPTDILLAAIAGGGDPATLSEPTAGGNSAIIPASAATVPPAIGGRNGGSGESTNAASNN
ncbi:hypothetical protein [Colwellia sp. MEBiC06753]